MPLLTHGNVEKQHVLTYVDHLKFVLYFVRDQESFGAFDRPSQCWDVSGTSG